MMSRKVGNQFYFVERGKRKLLEMGLDFNSERFLAKDTLIYSEHITGESIIQMDYQQAPYNQLWCVSEDGHIALMKRLEEQKTQGWSKIITDGDFESVAVIAGEPPEAHGWVFNKYLIGSFDDDTLFTEYATQVVKGPSTGTGFGVGKYLCAILTTIVIPTVVHHLYLYYSSDEGKTWDYEEVSITDTLQEIDIAVDSVGNVYIGGRAGSSGTVVGRVDLYVKTTEWLPVDSTTGNPSAVNKLAAHMIIEGSKVHIVYRAKLTVGGAEALLHVRRDSVGVWVKKTIQSGSTIYTTTFSNLRIDSTGELHLVNSVNGTKYFYTSGGQTTWNVENVATSGTVPMSMVLDSDDKPHVILHTSSNKSTSYTNRVSGSWIAPEQLCIAEVGGYDDSSSLSINTDDTLSFFYELEIGNSRTLSLKQRISGVWGDAIVLETDTIDGVYQYVDKLTTNTNIALGMDGTVYENDNNTDFTSWYFCTYYYV